MMRPVARRAGRLDVLEALGGEAGVELRGGRARQPERLDPVAGVGLEQVRRTARSQVAARAASGRARWRLRADQPRGGRASGPTASRPSSVAGAVGDAARGAARDAPAPELEQQA